MNRAAVHPPTPAVPMVVQAVLLLMKIFLLLVPVPLLP